MSKLAVRSAEEDDMLARLRASFQPSAAIRIREFFSGRYDVLKLCEESIERPGSHIVLYGDRGVGKTSVANIMELFHTHNTGGARDPVQRAFSAGCNSADTYQSIWRKLLGDFLTQFLIDAEGERENANGVDNAAYAIWDVESEFGPTEVLAVLKAIGGVPLIVLDEFDTLGELFNKRLFAETVKAISDHLPHITLMIVGVGATIGALIGEHPSLSRNLVQIKLKGMIASELEEIVEKGLNGLGMTMDRVVLINIVELSCGYPYYTHLLSYHACRSAIVARRKDVNDFDLRAAHVAAVEQSEESLKLTYQSAIAAKDPRIYKAVLWAIAAAERDEHQSILAKDLAPHISTILGEEVDPHSYIKHLSQLSTPKRASILQTVDAGDGRSHYRFTNPLMRPFLRLHYNVGHRFR